MAHKTLVGGTAYEISGGKTLVGGTGYSISKGRTLVGGTGYDVSFFTVPALEYCTPEEIKTVAKTGQAPNYWSVGDKIGITLNGTVGAITFNNDVYYAFIIGFDHNSSIEGGNSIHFQFGKTSAGVDISFVDSHYGTNTTKEGFLTGFCMNTSRTTAGGWESSYMRNTICPAFKIAMPTAWQNVIAPVTKYSDNTGGSNETYVTATSDDIWLLSEFELQGKRVYANTYEKNYQQQYAYYAAGNSKVKYKHSATTTACYWWFRSVCNYTSNYSKYRFCCFDSGSVNFLVADASYGFAPCFMVA